MLIHGNFEGAAQRKVYAGLLLPVIPRATSGWYLLLALVIAGRGLGLLVSQLNNYTLAPTPEAMGFG